jgi:hypothetical protein
VQGVSGLESGITYGIFPVPPQYSDHHDPERSGSILYSIAVHGSHRDELDFIDGYWIASTIIPKACYSNGKKVPQEMFEKISQDLSETRLALLRERRQCWCRLTDIERNVRAQNATLIQNNQEPSTYLLRFERCPLQHFRLMGSHYFPRRLPEGERCVLIDRDDRLGAKDVVKLRVATRFARICEQHSLSSRRLMRYPT